MRSVQDGLDPNLRLLAPIAVAVFAVAFAVIVLSSGALFGGGSSSESATSDSGERRAERSDQRRSRRESSSGRASYTVGAGDTLGSIASDNGVSVERIQELNPQVDPQALTAGQRIRLRE
jgi:Tfp pilus assembly protein FimV